MAGGGATRLVVSSLRERGPALWGQLPGPGTHGRTDARSSSVYTYVRDELSRSRCVNGGVFIIFIKYRSSNAIRAQHISMSEVQNKAEKSKRAQCAGDATGLVLKKLSLLTMKLTLSVMTKYCVYMDMDMGRGVRVDPIFKTTKE